MEGKHNEIYLYFNIPANLVKIKGLDSFNRGEKKENFLLKILLILKLLALHSYYQIMFALQYAKKNLIFHIPNTNVLKIKCLGERC